MMLSKRFTSYCLKEACWLRKFDFETRLFTQVDSATTSKPLQLGNRLQPLHSSPPRPRFSQVMPTTERSVNWLRHAKHEAVFCDREKLYMDWLRTQGLPWQVPGGRRGLEKR